MTYDDLSRALADPMTLTAYHLEDLLELSRQYPYCSSSTSTVVRMCASPLS